MDKKSIQKKLLAIVKDVSPINASYIEELADLLQISSDSIYRRLRGETDLTAEEAAIICEHYRISFDNLISVNDNSVSFNFKSIHSEEDFLAFFVRMHKDLQAINKGQTPMVTFAAFDIPLFHHFMFPLLTEFKMFSWMSSVLCLPNYTDKIFEQNIISDEMMSVCRGVWTEYQKVNSREVWTENTINSTLKQLEFHWDSGKIKDRETILKLVNEFKDELRQIELMASKSSKLEGENKVENYQVYYSETEIGNNCIQVNLGKDKAVYLTHNTFNTLTTFNQHFNSETEIWIENLIRKSEIISGISQKRRYQFFKKAIGKVDEFLERI